MNTVSNSDQSALVLIVEDEAPVRCLESAILEGASYRTIAVPDAEAAHAVLQSHDDIDLVLTDLDLHGTSGEDVANCVRASRPDVKVLYVSGKVDRLLDERGLLDENEAFLCKPFSAKGLVEAVSLLVYGKLRVPAKPEKSARRSWLQSRVDAILRN